MKFSIKLLSLFIIIIISISIMTSCDNKDFSVTVTFNINGAEGEDIVIIYDDTNVISLPDNPSREGYLFGGWGLTPDGQTIVVHDYINDEEIELPKELTLYALWRINTYTVSFDSDGGSSVVSQQIDYNTTLTAPEGPSKIGHVFIGWYLGDDEYDFSAPITSNLTLTAKWQLSDYNITLDPQGGTVTPTSKGVLYGEQIGALPNPAKDNSVFMGWNTLSDGLGEYYYSTTPYGLDDDLTLYAIWAWEQFVVTFDSNGGDDIDDIYVNYNHSINSSQINPTHSDTSLLFIGYYSDEALTDTFNLETLITYDITIYLGWATNTDLFELEYQPDKDGYYIIGWDTELIDKPEEIIISTYNGTDDLILGISDNAFDGCNSLRKVTITSGILYIGQESFKECINLESVVIGKDVETIGIRAFYLNKSLDSVTFSEESSLKTINEYAFAGFRGVDEFDDWQEISNKLTSIAIPASVEVIGESAFEFNTELASVTFANNSSLTTLGSSAFMHCVVLDNIVLPNSIYNMGEMVFAYCESLTSINIPTSMTIIPDRFLESASSLLSVNMHNDILSIGIYAFYATGLQSVVIPKETTIIKHNAFNSCTNLTTVSFVQDSKLETISMNAFIWCSSLQIINLSDSVITIGDAAFANTISLTAFIINPTSLLQTIGNNALNGSGITSIFIPKTITSLGEGVFKACSSLSEIIFDEDITITALPSEFAPNTTIVSITIPKTIQTIGHKAFEQCFSLLYMYVDILTPPELLGVLLGAGTNIKEIRVPYSSLNAYKAANIWSTYSAEIFALRYEIIFDSQGGSTVEGQMVGHGELIAEPSKPVLSGFTFLEWFTDSEATEPYDFNIPVVGDMTLYAGWTDKPVVFFDSGSDTSIAYQILNSGDSAFEPSISRDGYNFMYWTSGIDAYNFNTPVVQSITLFARWEIIDYVITYDLNGGNNNLDNPATYTIEDNIILQDPDDRNGYDFIGWYDNDEFNGDKIEDIEIGNFGEIKLYASWELLTYDIIFHYKEDGEFEYTLDSERFTILSADIVIYELIRDHYIFLGWYDNPSFEGETITVVPAGSFGNVELYASWERIMYTVTFNSRGGTAIDSESIGSGSKLSEPEEPTKLDLVFSGWYVDEDMMIAYDFEANVVSNLTLYAYWETDSEIFNYVEEIYLGINYITIKGFADGVTVPANIVIPRYIDGLPVGLIGNAAFFDNENNYNIVSVHIPYTVVYLGYGAFGFSSSLESASFDMNIALNYFGYSMFVNCTSLINIQLPNLTTISDYAFKDCTALTQITIPDSIETIGVQAFMGCTNLIDVIISGNSNLNIISAEAFSSCGKLENINLPSTLNIIANRAFEYCNNISNFILPYNLTHIGDEAFIYTAITSINLPESLISLGSEAFAWSQLTSIEIPSSITTLSDYALENCEYLIEIILNEGMETIGRQAFGNTSITSITIPSTVTSIDIQAFLNCDELKYVTMLPLTPPTIGSDVFIGTSVELVIYVPRNKIFEYETEWAEYAAIIEGMPCEVTLVYNNGDPDDYVVVGYLELMDEPQEPTKINHTFAGWFVDEELTIEFDFSMTAVSDDMTLYAAWETAISLFEYTTDLIDNTVEITGTKSGIPSEIIIPKYIEGKPVVSIAAEAFKDMVNLYRITMHNYIVNIGDDAFNGCNSLDNLVIPQSVVTVGARAFAGLASLEALSAPINIMYMGDLRMNNKIRILTLTESSDLNKGIPDGTDSDYLAKYFFMKLTTLTIGNGITSIGEYAFYNCSMLWEVRVGEDVESIGNYAFYGTNLGGGTFYISEKLNSIAPFAIGKSFVRSFTISPSNLTFTAVNDILINVVDNAIVKYPLKNMGNTYTIPNNITIIYPYAFCRSYLEYINIPATVTSIGNGAFSYSNIIDIVVPEGVERIEDETFHYCESLNSVLLPSTLTFIGDYAFSNCYNLELIDLPDSVSEIGVHAFEYSGLVSITLPESLLIISSHMFWYSNNLEEVFIPSSATDIEQGAFYDCLNLVSVTIYSYVCPNVFTGEFRPAIDPASQVVIYVPNGSVNDYETHADWSKYYIQPIMKTVTLVYNNGDDDTTHSVHYDGTFSEPDEPEKVGYSFIGWSTQEESYISYSFSSIVKSDFILYAFWVEEK